MRKILFMSALLVAGCGSGPDTPKPKLPAGAFFTGGGKTHWYTDRFVNDFDDMRQKGEPPITRITTDTSRYYVKGLVHGKLTGWSYIYEGKLYLEQPDGSYEAWEVIPK